MYIPSGGASVALSSVCVIHVGAISTRQRVGSPNGTIMSDGTWIRVGTRGVLTNGTIVACLAVS